jgi:topoisomerase-4 subunit A
LTPPAGASFVSVLGGDLETTYLLASDAGYGFRVKLADLLAKNKAGKSVLNLPKGARVLPPVPLADAKSDRLVAISNEGRMLVFPVAELPELVRGKGNKIISIPAKRVEARDEFVVAITAVPTGHSLTAFSGKRHFTLKPADLDSYQGERGRRGNKLPRGFQRVERVEVN